MESSGKEIDPYENPFGLTKRQIDDANIGSKIYGTIPKNAEIWYGHSMLTAILFPATPAEATENDGYITRQIGNYEYIMEASIDPENKDRMLPYGKYPRLLMAWMAKQIRVAGKKVTEYVNPEMCTITIPSLSHLAEELGLGRGGTTLKDLNEHIKRMMLSYISIHQVTGFAGGKKRHEVLRVPFARAASYQQTEDEGNDSFRIMLDPEVFRRLATETAPFDTRASNALLSGRSVMAYDIYIWLVGSLHSLNKPMTFGWDWLKEHFGTSIKDDRNFRQKFRAALKRVQTVYPDAKFTVSTKNGLTLLPSRSAIQPTKESSKK